MNFQQIFMGWGPVILLIVVWLLVMSKYGKRTQKNIELIEKHSELLERMVVANEDMAESLRKMSDR